MIFSAYMKYEYELVGYKLKASLCDDVLNPFYLILYTTTGTCFFIIEVLLLLHQMIPSIMPFINFFSSSLPSLQQQP